MQHPSPPPCKRTLMQRHPHLQSASVTVSYASRDITATSATSDYTAKSGSLSFTTTNWATPQTISVAVTLDNQVGAGRAQ